MFQNIPIFDPFCKYRTDGVGLAKISSGPLSCTKSGVVILIKNLGNHIEFTGSVAVTNMNLTIIIAQFDKVKGQINLLTQDYVAIHYQFPTSSRSQMQDVGNFISYSTFLKQATVDLDSGDLLQFITDGITKPHCATSKCTQNLNSYTSII